MRRDTSTGGHRPRPPLLPLYRCCSAAPPSSRPLGPPAAARLPARCSPAHCSLGRHSLGRHSLGCGILSAGTRSAGTARLAPRSRRLGLLGHDGLDALGQHRMQPRSARSRRPPLARGWACEASTRARVVLTTQLHARGAKTPSTSSLQAHARSKRWARSCKGGQAGEASSVPKLLRPQKKMHVACRRRVALLPPIATSPRQNPMLRLLFHV